MEIFKWNYFFGVTVFVFLFGGGIQHTGACQPQENRTDATAQAFYQNEAQVVTSCHGFSSDTIEVHVVGIYESVASDSDGEEILTSLVDIRGETNKSVVLILFSRGHVTWLVDAANAINLRVAIQITNSTFSAVDLSRIYNNEHINVRTRSIPYGADSLDDASDLIRTISAEFGFVTSFAGTVRADRWLLTLDGHGRIQECLQEADCWLRYNFTYDDNWTACRGAQYVKHTPFDVGTYLGVVLCSETRYKLFMGDDLEEKFLNMADGSGSGQDYCILIGGDEASARLAGNGFDSPSATGYYRSFAGETPRIGPIGFGPKDLSAWTGRYYPTWYECGVSIPGNSTVVSVSADAWDDVTFGQAKFTTDRTFIVPAGVTRVDVICIGGGGGGRDDQAEFMEGEDGGNSTFGAYLGAQGGMGGKLNNAGGEGGYGTVANGGQAGAGGGCSAGGGAAGQTSGGGHGGLEAGSSFHPFCGAGGSSGGSSCGQEFANIAQGTSGPGGTAPANREPGLYGGGGGSRAGGRAGGGGGYSRATVNVTPGERIIIRVGAAANEGRWVGTSAPGVVVVSWGGPINATGPFVNIGTVSEVAPPTTTPPLLSTTPIITLPRTQCGFSYHCSGSYRMRAVCIDGYCQCRGSGYNQYTCLPEVGSCRILANQDSALATTTAGLEVHSCVGDSSNSSHDVHVLGIYENSGSRGRVFPTTVRIEGSTSKPMVLVVSNYEPVRWVIRAQPEVDLRKVLLFSYHHTGSTVAIHGGRNPSAVRVVKARSPSGRGNDAGGGRTAELLALLTENYGSVASFTGTYRTNSWVLRLPASSSTSVSPATAEPSTASTTPNSSTAANANSVQACLRSSDCWVQYNFTYDGNFTACTGAQYVRQTRYMVGRYIGAVLCTSTRFKLVMADDLEDVFLNVGDGSGAGEDLCDLIGGSKDAANLPSDFWNSPSAYDCEGFLAQAPPMCHWLKHFTRDVRFEVECFRITDSGFQKGMIGYGPPWTGHYFPTWYECRGVSIPGNSQVMTLSIEGATTTTSGTTVVQATASTRRNSSTEANTPSPIVLTTIVLTTAAVTTIHPTSAAPATASTTPKSSSSAITHSVRACLRSSNCWVQYNFTYDRNFTACTGAQYVTQTRYSVGRYIGAVLCTSTRFKLVMADDLGDVFLNVGDGSGAGEDLCDLIGGSKDEANLPLDFWDSPSAYGYRIVASGFVKGLIGYGPPWTGQYYPTWYECRGVAIPGNSQVIPLAIEGATTVTSATTTTPTVESTTTQAAIDWGNATFGQLKFEADGVFVVPAGVRLVDVICIGGGGGGRDGHSAFTRSPGYGGDGGNSSFGEYVWAEGGKGALRNDSGGGGGRGMTRDGGQGGVGGGCSAGAGAAGQTSGGGGGLIGGSSSLPFCGGGGSSGGSSCGTEFGDIGPATSGPGGRDPENRAGGLYGGGGGSRAGGRAGGGGGYSRATISVTPGQMVNVTVGRAGTPHYRRPGPGLVVVSWGGPINPLFGG